MAVKLKIGFVIAGIFGAIFLLFFFAWGGSFVVGAIGLAISLLLYSIIIVITPLSKFFIRITHHCEISTDKMFNALLIAVAFYYGAMRIAARIAALFLLICRLFFSFVIFICTHRWDSAFITYYLSELPLKIFMIVSSPFEALLEWFIQHLNFNSIIIAQINKP